MSYLIRDDRGMVELTFNEEVNYNEFNNAQGEAFKLCKSKRLSLLHIELHEVELKVSTIELYEIGKSLKKAELNYISHISIVFKEEDTNVDMLVAVAQTRGVNIKSFLTRESAFEWLNVDFKHPANLKSA